MLPKGLAAPGRAVACGAEPSTVPGAEEEREGGSATFTTALTHPLTLHGLPAWERLTP